jgi:hypothetical protein
MYAARQADGFRCVLILARFVDLARFFSLARLADLARLRGSAWSVGLACFVDLGELLGAASVVGWSVCVRGLTFPGLGIRCSRGLVTSWIVLVATRV